MIQRAIVAMAVVASIIVLAFLIRKTESAPLDLGAFNSRLEQLHQTAALELGLRSELERAAQTLDSGSAGLERTVQTLRSARQVVATGDRASAGVAPEVDAALNTYLQTAKKQDPALDQYPAQLRKLSDSFNTLREQSRELLANTLPTQEIAVRQRVMDLVAAVADYVIQSTPANGPAIDALVGGLDKSAQAFEQGPRTALRDLLATVATVRADRDALGEQAEMIRKASPFNDLVGLITAYSRHYQLQQDTVHRFQLILSIYATLLLLVFGSLGLKLRGSFVELDHINAELQQTNTSLERRVDERTRDLRKALDDLRMNEAQLIQSEKMASLGQMVAGMAHEINTPLGYARGNVETVRESLATQPDNLGRFTALLNSLTGDTATLQPGPQTEVRKELDELILECDTLLGDTCHGLETIADLVMSLKNFSRVDRSHTEMFDVNEGLETSIKICGSQFKNRVQIEKDYKELPRIPCAPSQLNQVFLNILSNAAQAIDGEGMIRVRTRVLNSHVEIGIRDSGCGMDAETQAHIFEPFFTTKDVGKGTGLGLSIVYRIIQDHHGTIRVESEPGKGSEFIITLPRSASQAKEDTKQPPVTAKAERQSVPA